MLQENSLFGWRFAQFQNARRAGVADAVDGGEGDGFGWCRDGCGGRFAGENLGFPGGAGAGLHGPPAHDGIGAAAAPLQTNWI